MDSSVSPFFHRSVASALLIGPVVLLASGCVTIPSGSSEDIRTESDPDGASVFVDGLRRGSETPTTLTLEHSYSDVWDGKEVTLELDGYEDRTFEIDSGISGWYWGNLLFPIGAAVVGAAVTSDDLDGAVQYSNIVSIGSLIGAAGSIVDLVTGSWVKTDDTQYTLELREDMSGTGAFRDGSGDRANYVQLSLDQLERDDEGKYLTPEPKRPVAVYDAVSGYNIIFRKK